MKKICVIIVGTCSLLMGSIVAAFAAMPSEEIKFELTIAEQMNVGVDPIFLIVPKPVQILEDFDLVLTSSSIADEIEFSPPMVTSLFPSDVVIAKNFDLTIVGHT